MKKCPVLFQLVFAIFPLHPPFEGPNQIFQRHPEYGLVIPGSNLGKGLRQIQNERYIPKAGLEEGWLQVLYIWGGGGRGKIVGAERA